MLLFDGFELLDACGPLEMFGVLRDRIQIVTTAFTPGLVASSSGVRLEAMVSLEELSPVDAFLIPGGVGTRQVVKQPELCALLRAVADRTATVGTICTGTGVLAATGLLDGHRATTNKISFAWPKAQGPRVIWVPEARWVEDGKFITSAGVSAGMDMALALIARWFGGDVAENVARYTEYDWHRDPSWDPFARMARLVD